MNQANSPWVRGSFKRKMGSFVWKDTNGWVSRYDVLGLHWQEKEERYILTHIPTGCSMLSFENHELAAAWIKDLQMVCDLSRAHLRDPWEYPGFIEGINMNTYIESREIAIATLGARRPPQPKVIAR